MARHSGASFLILFSLQWLRHGDKDNEDSAGDDVSAMVTTAIWGVDDSASCDDSSCVLCLVWNQSRTSLTPGVC